MRFVPLESAPIALGRRPWRQAAALRAPGAWHSRRQQVVWVVVLVALGLASVSTSVQAQLVRPFTARYTNNAPGDIYIIGNTLLSCVPTPTWRAPRTAGRRRRSPRHL